MSQPDRAIERLLRERRESFDDTTSECLDVETLAAWADDTLGPSERKAALAHCAECGRCQALLATMARTAPPLQPRATWRNTLRWLVPVTAAVSAVALWMVVPERQSPPLGVNQVSSREQPAAAPADERQEAGATLAQSEPPPPSGLEEFPKRDQPATPPSSSSEVRSSNERLDAKSAEALKEEVLASDAVAPALTDADRPAEAQVAEKAGSPSPSAVGQATRAVASQDALARQAQPSVDVVASNPAVRWRFRTRGVVEHTVDGGATWQQQPTTVDAIMLAGSAPTSTVCWFVGVAGTVVVTTDGAVWRHVAFPEVVDLVSVDAGDAKTATVTAADGRVFRTSDGGVTWTSSP